VAGWPAIVPPRFADAQKRGLNRFMEGFDGEATARTRGHLRQLLGLTAA
jgi:hypothetical protein